MLNVKHKMLKNVLPHNLIYKFLDCNFWKRFQLFLYQQSCDIEIWKRKSVLILNNLSILCLMDLQIWKFLKIKAQSKVKNILSHKWEPVKYKSVSEVCRMSESEFCKFRWAATKHANIQFLTTHLVSTIRPSWCPYFSFS